MASRALTSTVALILCLLLVTNMLSSARADCPIGSAALSSACKVASGQRTVSADCCNLVQPLNPSDAVECICKGNPGENIENLYGLLGSSCNRATPRSYIDCSAFSY